jgi:hypothetical protein
MPRVSVIIPSYNLARLVPQAIQSVLDQTYTDFEVLVVDDGSQDNTREVIQSFDDARVQYIYQENRGLSGARNTGIQQAQGEFLAFLDADDTFFPNKLAGQVAALDRQPEVGLVAGGYWLVDENNQPLQEKRNWEHTPTLAVETWLFGCPFIVNAVLARREWVVRVGGFDPALRRVEDRDLWLRLAYAGCPMAWVPAIVCAYRMHLGQMVRAGSSQKNVSLQVMEKFFAQPDLPVQYSALRERVYAAVQFEGACREYASGEFSLAPYSLEKAIQEQPGLLNGEPPQMADALISWAIDPLSANPAAYMAGVLEHLPPSAHGLRQHRQWLLYAATVRGSLEALLVKNTALAQKILRQSLEHQPRLSENPALAIQLAGDYVRGLPISDPAAVLDDFFAALPQELESVKAQRRPALARLHMARGFDAAEQGKYPQAAGALWQGARLDPAWLRNRGVWAVWLKSLLGRR